MLPASAQALLAEDKVDLELFNVSELVDEGYDDGVPVIVDYRTPRRRRTALARPDGTERSESLPSISAVAARTVAEEGDAFWADISTEAPGRSRRCGTTPPSRRRSTRAPPRSVHRRLGSAG